LIILISAGGLLNIEAAGDLEIESAKEQIIEFLKNSTPDEELHTQAIWALSKIGGNDIKELFEDMIEESEDDEKPLEVIRIVHNYYICTYHE
jgi:hypothetical protein